MEVQFILLHILVNFCATMVCTTRRRPLVPPAHCDKNSHRRTYPRSDRRHPRRQRSNEEARPVIEPFGPIRYVWDDSNSVALYFPSRFHHPPASFSLFFTFFLLPDADQHLPVGQQTPVAMTHTSKHTSMWGASRKKQSHRISGHTTAAQCERLTHRKIRHAEPRQPQ